MSGNVLPDMTTLKLHGSRGNPIISSGRQPEPTLRPEGGSRARSAPAPPTPTIEDIEDAITLCRHAHSQLGDDEL